MDEPTSDKRIRRAVLQRLESLERAGLRELPRPVGAKRNAATANRREPVKASDSSLRVQPAEPAPVTAAVRESEAASTPVSASPPAAAPKQSTGTTKGASLFAAAGWDGAPNIPAEQRQPALDLICGQVRGCERCRELATTRTQTVFGVGDPNARLCFMGEAPGADEDRQGEPFVGRAGQLLNKIIEACGLRRQDVYILNTLKCRPPGNRNPLPNEVANCREFLNRQLDIIQPQFICCLGLVAAQALLGVESSMSRLRKRFFDYRGSRVLCTYHPAYLLRNPSAKKDVWEDMQLLLKEMGIALPTR
ncbi:MAG TPA: uracil-DNA glycosylase family protein [Pirellulales bacterium]|nr:uracil-DNA glycosylase family protein [Pirellulales bacterium]